jgi:hypothetical protein
MSERNGDKARFQKNRKRKLHQRHIHGDCFTRGVSGPEERRPSDAHRRLRRPGQGPLGSVTRRLDPTRVGCGLPPQRRRHVHYSARSEQDVATIFNDLTANVPVVFLLPSSLTAPSDTGLPLAVVPVVPVAQ